MQRESSKGERETTKSGPKTRPNTVSSRENAQFNKRTYLVPGVNLLDKMQNGR